jgi:hypothetical protein
MIGNITRAAWFETSNLHADPSNETEGERTVFRTFTKQQDNLLQRGVEKIRLLGRVWCAHALFHIVSGSQNANMKALMKVDVALRLPARGHGL